jgi:hypothetical protein
LEFGVFLDAFLTLSFFDDKVSLIITKNKVRLVLLLTISENCPRKKQYKKDNE